MAKVKMMATPARNLNNATFTDYYLRLSMLALEAHRWNGLPNSMKEKWIEKFELDEGECVVYDDFNLGLIVTKFTADNRTNDYDDYTVVRPVGTNIDSSRKLKVGEDCVIIRNNSMGLPTSYFIKQFAMRLSEVTRAIDINVNAQKTPLLMTGTDKQQATLKQVYAKYDGNEPVIYADKSLNLNPDVLRVISTEAPVVFPQLQDQKQSIWNECLTFLGINNANTDKRERLITDEVKANDVHIDMSAECFLQSRKEAAAEINRIFGTNITVERRNQEVSEPWQNTQSKLEP